MISGASGGNALPNIVLTNQPIPMAVLSYIPIATSQRYGVIAFASDEHTLRLALAHPEQLRPDFISGLNQIGLKIGKKIELFKTDDASLQYALKLYESKIATSATPPRNDTTVTVSETKQTQPTPSVDLTAISGHSISLVNHKGEKVPPPPLFKLGSTVAFNYLRRVPLQFGKDNRLISVDFMPPNIYWFVTDGSKDKQLEKILPFLEEKNHIKVHLMKVTRQDLDDLFAYYSEKLGEINKQKAEEDAKRLLSEKAEQNKANDKHTEGLERAMGGQNEITGVDESGKKITLADGVVVPDVQAAIINSETEKPGLAGLWQKATQSFSAKNEPVVISDGHDVSGKEIGLNGENVFGADLPQVSGEIKNTTDEAKQTDVTAGGSETVPTDQPVIKASGTTIFGNQGVVDMSKDKINTNVPDPIQHMTDKQVERAKQNTATEDDGNLGKLLEKPVENADELKDHIRRGFIPTIVAAIVSYAIHEKASDIHVEAFQDEVRVRYRVDGQLLEIIKLPPDVHAAMVSRIKILSHLKLDETRIPQDGRFDVEVNDRQIDLRVSVMPTVNGEKVVMRILEKSKGVTSLDELGILGLGYKKILDAINRPFGVCLAAGPTGSGKSTTLYAILNLIATSNVNVITLEDPVEYEMKGINQSQIRPKIGFTFAEGLRSVLRQDPNIIMVGEIRDGETANMATQAALTGHLVLSTLHTNEASGAIPRLMNMGIEPFLISSSLNVVVGQRLVRKICQHCKTEINIPEGVKANIVKEIEAINLVSPMDFQRVKPPYKFYQGVGCEQCKGKGYQGRIGIYEVLSNSEAIENLTLSHASANQVMEQAQKEGMISMYQDGLLKMASGITTLDEVLRETSNK